MFYYYSTNQMLNQDHHRKHHAQPRNRHHIPAQGVLRPQSHVAIALRLLPNRGDGGDQDEILYFWRDF